MKRWLEAREPEAPAELRQRVMEAVAAHPSESGPVETLVQAGETALDTAVRRPGRVRETAYELLVADALVTYACEAALETDRPLEALERIVEVGRTR